ncbi:MAG: FHA domain-containing protein, partial [bacterium]
MSMSGDSGKPKIDKEYLKKLAEKIKAEREKKQQDTSGTEESQQKQEEVKPSATSPDTPPEPPSQPPPDAFGEVEEEEEMAAEKTAIIDLASLSGQSAKAKLTLLDGKDEGKTVDISREEMFAGRSLDNDFVISDISVSRKHFKVTCEDDIYYATDLGSGNGIRVNGEKKDRTRLYHNDTIIAGARHVRFEVVDEKLLEINSRKKTPETSEKSVAVKSGNKSLLPWIAAIIFLLIGIGAAGVYFYPNIEKAFFASEPTHTPAMVELDKTMSKLDSSALDFEERKKTLNKADTIISTMSREEREDPAVIKHKKDIEKALKESGVFLTAQKLYELGKNENIDEKTAEAVEKFKELPKDSIFFPDVISQLGKDTVFGWSAEKIENSIEEKDHKKAAEELSRLKKAYPGYEKIPELEKKLAEIK